MKEGRKPEYPEKTPGDELQKIRLSTIIIIELSCHNYLVITNMITTKTDSPGEVHLEGNVVVQVREGNAVLCTHWLSDDDLVDVVELVPVFISETSFDFFSLHGNTTTVDTCVSQGNHKEMNNKKPLQCPLAHNNNKTHVCGFR